MAIFQNSGRNSTTYVVAATANSTASSTAFSAGIRQVRIASNINCHYTFGASPTATASHPLLPQLTVEYVTVTPGQKLAVIQAASDGAITADTGSIWVTELTG